MPKKKMNKQQRHDQRIRKAKQWMTTYTGTPKKMTRHYREKFHLDINTAIRDLQEIGVEFTQEYLEEVRKTETARIKKKQEEKRKREQELLDFLYEDCDDTYAFIVGYTSGGAAYGTTWEEVGIAPELPFEEKVRLYQELMI